MDILHIFPRGTLVHNQAMNVGVQGGIWVAAWIAKGLDEGAWACKAMRLIGRDGALSVGVSLTYAMLKHIFLVHAV